MAPQNSKRQPKREPRIAGLIYAGGRGARMGGVDKAVIKREGRPLIAHMSRALGGFVDHIYITRQDDQLPLSDWGEVIVDQDRDQGPLSGLVATIKKASDEGYEFLLSAAVDATSLPEDYLERLQEAAIPHAMARSGDDVHPTFALYDLSDCQMIISAYEGGERALRSWVNAQNCGYAIFATGAFENINSD